MPGVKSVIDFEAETQRATEILNNADWLFCLDFNTLNRTKGMEKSLHHIKAVKILIDHHHQPDEEAFHFGISNSNKSSTCEMVYDFIVNSGNSNKLNTDIATCLYTGIMTDTGSFRFPSTTAAVHRIVAHLMELGIHHTTIHENIYDSFLETRLRFIGNALLNRLEVLYEYNTALMVIPKSDVQKFEIKTGDTEGLVNFLHTIKGIKLAAIVVDREGERKWSFRSKYNFDVSIFARKHFNGGGHSNASGGNSKDSLNVTVEKFREILKLYKEELQ
jgi:phosphoesterase RecJ-like protein